MKKASMAKCDVEKGDKVRVKMVDGEEYEGEVLRTFKNKEGVRGARVQLDEPFVDGSTGIISAFVAPWEKCGEKLISVRKKIKKEHKVGGLSYLMPSTKWVEIIE